MSGPQVSVALRLARSAAAIAVVFTVATIALWSIAVMAIQTAFSEWLYNDHLTLAVCLTIGLGSLASGLALMALDWPSRSPRSRALAQFALKCVGIAVVTSAGMWLLSSGQGG